MKKIIKMVYLLMVFFLKKKINRVVFIDGQNMINIEYLYEIMSKDKKKDILVITDLINKDINTAKLKSLKAFYYLATSGCWITDSNCKNLFTNGISPQKTVKYIQVWHSVGAIKKFGLDSISDELLLKDGLRKESEIISKVIVSSDIWVKPFISAFNITEDKISVLGHPRTDLFFDEYQKKNYNKYFFKKYPELKAKKIIMYAPTFRDDNISNFNLELDINLFINKLPNDHILLLRLHPNIKSLNINLEKNSRVITLKDEKNINKLLLITDVLITDYSSICFEYSLLEKPMIFFAYDLEKYKDNIRGFYFDYEKFVPGKIVKTTEEIIKIIKMNNYDLKKIIKFKQKNFKYLDGKSSGRVYKLIYNELKKEE